MNDGTDACNVIPMVISPHCTFILRCLEGRPLTLPCHIADTSEINITGDYSWFKLENGEYNNVITRFEDNSVVRGHKWRDVDLRNKSLFIPTTSYPRDQGYFTCRMFKESTTIVEILVPPQGVSIEGSSINGTDYFLGVYRSQRFIITCVVERGNPSPIFSWAVNDESRDNYMLPDPVDEFKSVLMLDTTSLQEGSCIECLVNNSVGNPLMVAVRLHFKDVDVSLDPNENIPVTTIAVLVVMSILVLFLLTLLLKQMRWKRMTTNKAVPEGRVKRKHTREESVDDMRNEDDGEDGYEEIHDVQGIDYEHISHSGNCREGTAYEILDIGENGVQQETTSSGKHGKSLCICFSRSPEID